MTAPGVRECLLDCGCLVDVWRPVKDAKTSCPRHSEFLGPHGEDGLPVYLTDRTVVKLGGLFAECQSCGADLTAGWPEVMDVVILMPADMIVGFKCRACGFDWPRGHASRWPDREEVASAVERAL